VVRAAAEQVQRERMVPPGSQSSGQCGLLLSPPMISPADRISSTSEEHIFSKTISLDLMLRSATLGEFPSTR